jgi:hypothetical protein
MDQEYKNYISLHEAEKYCSYSQEYLALRIRQGKLMGKKLGRNWVTRKEWLDDYSKQNRKGLGGSFNNFFPNFRNNFISAKKPFFNTEKFSITSDIISEIVPPERISPIKNNDKFLSLVFTVVFLLFFLSIIFAFPSSQKYSNESQLADVSARNVLQITADAFVKYGKWFGDGIKNQIGKIKKQFVFSEGNENLLTETTAENKYQNEGMVVVPSSDNDELQKQKIKESFSDEVVVQQTDNDSGIIIPIFKNGEGEKYLYMMVPIKN